MGKVRRMREGRKEIQERVHSLLNRWVWVNGNVEYALEFYFVGPEVGHLLTDFISYWVS